MKIETKYNLGDTLYVIGMWQDNYSKDDQYQIQCSIIVKKIIINEHAIYYSQYMYGEYKEVDLFPTKETALLECERLNKQFGYPKRDN